MDDTNSPAPGVPQTADKAKVGGIIAAAVLLVAVFLALYLDGKNGTNWAETLITVGIAVLGGGATYAGVFQTKNRETYGVPRKRRKGHAQP
jgi:hypothetical protein